MEMNLDLRWVLDLDLDLDLDLERISTQRKKEKESQIDKQDLVIDLKQEEDQKLKCLELINACNVNFCLFTIHLCLDLVCCNGARI